MQAELIAASSVADAAVWYFTLQGYFPVLFGLTGKPVPVPLLAATQSKRTVAPRSRRAHCAAVQGRPPA